MTENQNTIKKLFQEYEGKKSTLIQSVATEFDLKYKTVQNHWLAEYGGWSVPDDKQEQVIEILRRESVTA